MKYSDDEIREMADMLGRVSCRNGVNHETSIEIIKLVEFNNLVDRLNEIVYELECINNSIKNS